MMDGILARLMREPDGRDLAVMLGIIEDEPVAKRVANGRKDWCDVHNIPRTLRTGNGNRTVCRPCEREMEQKRRAARKARESVDS